MRVRGQPRYVYSLSPVEVLITVLMVFVVKPSYPLMGSIPDCSGAPKAA